MEKAEYKELEKGLLESDASAAGKAGGQKDMSANYKNHKNR